MLLSEHKQIKSVYLGITLVLAVAFSLPAFAQQGPSTLNVSGGLFLPSGAPVTSSGVNFRLEIWNKDATCLLYTEEHLAQDLSASKGGFALAIGRGTNISNLVEANNTLSSRIFENNGVLAGGWANCASGANLLPGDERVIRVHYNLGAGYIAMSPDVPIASAAYAMVAESLQGKRPVDFIQVRDDVAYDLDQTNVENVFSSSNYARLLQLLNPTAAVPFAGQRISNIATPTAASDAATKGYTDGNLGGQLIDLVDVAPGAGGGKVLTWDQTANRWVASLPSTTDNTKLPLAGGTMTGAINMGGNNLNNVGNISMGTTKTLNLGTFTNATEGALGLGATDAGKFWYNTQSGQLKVWNGTAAVPQAYLDAGGKLTAGWIPDTTVTGAAYGSATQVPTFTVGADGRLTAAANVTIAGVAPGGAAGGDLTGTFPNPSVANLAIGTSKLADNAVTSAKINSTGVATNRILITDGTTGATVTYANCPNNEILKFTTGTGWECATVASLSPVTSVAGKSGAVTLNAADIGGLGTASVRDIGVTPGDVPELDAGSKILAALIPLFGGDVTGAINSNVVTRLQGRDISSAAPNNNDVLMWNGTAWAPTVLVDAGITALTGDVSASGSGSVVATLSNGVVTTPKMFTNPGVNRLIATDSTTGATLAPFVCNLDEIMQWGASGWACRNVSTALGSQFIVDGGNVRGAAISIGTSDNYNLLFETNNQTRMTILTSGNVGIGNTNPLNPLDVTGAISASGSIASGAAVSATTNVTAGGSVSAGTNVTAVGNVTGANVFATGSMGVGTTSPARIFEVAGAMRVAPSALPGTPAAGDLAIDSGAGNSLKYHNGSSWISLAVGGTGDFMADGTVAMTGQFRSIAGNAGAPGMTFVGDLANGVFAPAANTFGVSTSGNERLRVTPAGLVGIGTTNPANALDVTGVISASGNITSGASLSATTNITAGGNISATGNATAANVYATNSLGVGTTSPARLLEVAGPIRIAASALPGSPGAGDVAIDSGAANTLKYHNGTSWVSLGTGNTTSNGVASYLSKFNSANSIVNSVMYENAGQIGIGNTNPSNALDVTGAISASGAIAAGTTVSATTNVTAGGNVSAVGSVSAGTNVSAAGNVTGANVFATSTMGVGTTSPARMLEVAGVMRVAPSALPGTPAAGDLAIDSGAGNSLKYHNGTNWISLAVGGTGDFRADGTVAMTGAFRSIAGNAGAPGMTFVGDVANGIFAPAANTFGVSTSGNERLRVTPAGLVGIGTTNPANALDVNGVISASGNISSGGIVSATGNVTSGASISATNNITAGGNIAATGNATAANVFATNSLGVGTTSPARLLEVAGPIRIAASALPGSPGAGDVAIDSGAANTLKYHNGTSWVSIGTGNTASTGTANYISKFNGANSIVNSVIYEAGGNVGIGTTSPSTRLQVQSTPAVADVFSVTDGTNYTLKAGYGGAGVAYFGGNTGSALGILANNSEVVRITNAGNVGIGTSLPLAKLWIRGSGATYNEGLALVGNGITNPSYLWNDASGNLNFSGNGLSTSIMTVTNNFVGIGTTSPNRLLEIAGPIRISPTALPGTPAAGDLAFDSSGNSLKFHNGTSWQTVGTSSATGDFMANGSIAMTGALRSIAGTATAPGITFVGDTSNGVFAPATNTFGVSTAGNERLRVTAAGLVGIGTTNPVNALDVTGVISASGNISSGGVVSATGNITSGASISATTNITAGGNISASGNATANNIFANTSLGVGTTSPARLLEVAGPIRIAASALPGAPGAGDVAIDSGAANMLKYHNGTSWVSIGTGNTASTGTANYISKFNGANSIVNSALYETGGQIGVGTTSPGAPLDVNGAVRATTAFQLGSSANTVGLPFANFMAFSTNSAERMVIDSTGRVAIGTTSPTTIFQVEGTSGGFPATSGSTQTGTPLRFRPNNSQALVLDIGGNASSGIWFQSTNRGDLSQNYPLLLNPNGGNVGLGTTAPTRLLEVAGPVRISPAALPGSPGAGDLAFDSGASNALKYHNGANWVSVGSGSGDFMANGSVNMTGTLKGVSGGTAATPAFTFAGDTDNGIYAPAADSLAFGTSGIERMRLTSAGFLGIGTSTPSAKLNVIGNVDVSGGVRLGTDATCNVGKAGLLAWNSNKLQICTSSGSFVDVGGTGKVVRTTSSGGTCSTDVNYGANPAGYCDWVTHTLVVDQTSDVIFTGMGNFSAAAGPINMFARLTINGVEKAAQAYSATSASYDTVTAPVIWTENLAPGTYTIKYQIGKVASANNSITGYNSFLMSQVIGGGLPTSGGGSDNLGNHTLLQNLITSSYWISGDGDNEGIRILANGNVGIGEVNPARKLDIAGPIRVSPTALPGSPGAGDIAIDSGAGNSLKYHNGSNWVSIGSGSGDFLANGSVPMTGAIQAIAGSATAPGINFVGDANTGIFSPTSDSVAIGTSGVEQVRVLANGNVGIGVTNPTNRLEVGGDALVTGGLTVGPIYSSNVTVMGNGTAAIPSYGFIFNAGSGMFTPGANLMAFSTNSAERLRIDANGNVGIGTTTPARRLEVAGQMRLQPSALPGSPGAGDIAIDSAASNSLKYHNGSNWVSIGSGSGDFLANGSVPMTGQFRSIAGTAVAPGMTFNGDTDNGIFAPAADQLAFSAGGVERMRLSGGSVGIGTTTPGDDLHVNDASNTNDNALALFTQPNLASGNQTYIIMGRSAANNEAGVIGYLHNTTQANRAITLSHYGQANSFYVYNNGNVGIGGSNASRTLQVNGAMKLSPIANPGSPTAGDIFVDSTASNTLKYHNGSSWISIAAGGSGDFLANGSVPMTGNLRLNNNWLSNDGGSEGIRIGNTGNVGVGTSAGTARLLLNGNFAFPNLDNGSVSIGFEGTAPPTGSNLAISAGAGDDPGGGTGGDLILNAGAASGAGGGTAGNLTLNAGAGTSAGSQAGDLQLFGGNALAGGGSTAGSVRIAAGMNTGGDPSGDISLQTGNARTTRIFIAENGMVGVGMSSPNRLLELAGPMRILPAPLPVSPLAGDLAFDSASSNALKFYNGSGWQTVGSGSGFAASGANADITSLNVLTAINGASLAIGNSATTTLNVGGAATGALTSTFGANSGASTTTLQSGTGGTSITSTGIGTSAVNLAVNGVNGGIRLAPNGTGVVTSTRPIRITPTTLPAGPTAGLMAIDSAASNTLKYYNGSAWVSVGLIGFTSSYNTTAPNATVPISVLAASGGASDIDIALSPKGQGAFTAQAADSAIAGGDKRGINAVDLQIRRGASTQVASGQASVLVGGDSNTATGAESAVLGGNGNTASNTRAVVLGGALSTASGLMSSVVSGASSTASGGYSSVIAGTNNTASGNYSVVAGGASNTSSGDHSFTTGYWNTSPTYAQTTVGGYSIVTGGTPNAWDPADPLFVIGNGTSDVTRSNAVTVLKNGNVAFGSSAVATGARLDIIGTDAASSSIILPRASTANRPAVGINGMLRYNTSNARFEGYQAGSWQNLISAGGLPAADGTVGTPSINFTNSTGMGLYRVSNNVLGVSTAGVNRVTVDASGNVGIGTTNPGFSLDSTGSISSSANGSFISRTTGGSYRGELGYYGAGHGVMQLSNSSAVSNIRLDAGANSYITGVNLGLGTTAPTRLLQVAGAMKITPTANPGSPTAGDIFVDSTASNTLKYHNGSAWVSITSGGSGDLLNGGNTGAVIVGSNNSTLSLEANNAVAMTVLSGGNVGIGTTNPLDSLSVYGSANGTGAGHILVQNAFNGTNAWGGIQAAADNAGVYTQFGHTSASYNIKPVIGTSSGFVAAATNLTLLAENASGQIKFATGGNAVSNERMRINQNGNVGIGTTNPTQKLELSGVNETVMLRIANRSSTTDQYPGIVIENYIGSGAAWATPKIQMINNGGNTGSPSAISNGSPLGLLEFWGSSDGTGAQQRGSLIVSTAAGNWSAGSTPGQLDFETTPVGSTSTVPRMRIDSAGRVGIGVSSPSRVLQVAGAMKINPTANPGSPTAGDIFVDSTASNTLKYHNGTAWVSIAGGGSGDFRSDGTVSMSGTIKLADGSYGDPAWQFASDATSGVYKYGTGSMAVRGGANLLIIDSVGVGFQSNLGAGMLTTGTTAGVPGLTFAGDTNVGVFRPAADTLGIATSGVERLRIASNGNVGIGTTNPTHPLYVRRDQDAPTLITVDNQTNGASSEAGFRIESPSSMNAGFVRFSDANTSDLDLETVVYSAGGEGLSLVTGSASGDIRFLTDGWTNAFERARITSAGRFGIGTNNPSRLLHVAGAMKITPTANPGTPTAGDIFVDSTASNALKYHNGSAWVSLTGGGSGLTYFTEGLSSAAPNNTVPIVSLTPNDGATNVDIALVRKGSGAIMNAIPDNTITGGNKRGAYSIDFSAVRTGADKVASGMGSALIGGAGGTASGQYSFVAGGEAATASARESTVIGGSSSSATADRASVIGGGVNVASGNSSFIGGGGYNTASGIYSFIGGGYGSTAPSMSQVTFGMYNSDKGGESAGSFVSTDPLFVIGNGTGSGARSNALMILKNGNVGIGNTVPSRLLQVGGAIKINPTANPGSPTAGDIFVDSTASNSLKYHNGSAWVTLGAGGGGLPAADGTVGTPSINFTNSANMGLYRISNNVLGLSTASTNRVTIDASGYVGIGTTTPGSLLHVVNTTPSNDAMIYVQNSSNSVGAQASILLLTTHAAADPYIRFQGPFAENFYLGVDSSDSGKFKIGSTGGAPDLGSGDSMTIDNSGRVGIGTTSPTTTLDVAGSVRASGQVRSGPTTGNVTTTGSTNIDWNNGNVQIMSVACGAVVFSNMLEGGTYTLVVTNTTSGTCTFSQSSPDTLLNAAFAFSPANGPTTPGTKSVFTFVRAGGVVYTSWTTGY